MYIQSIYLVYTHTKRKRGEEDEVPALSSLSYGTKVGFDPGLCYLFVAQNNTNVEHKKTSNKLSSEEYYHEAQLK